MNMGHCSKEDEKGLEQVHCSYGEQDSYNKFSEKRKKLLVFIVALSCFLSPASGMAFLPSIPEIKDEFNTTSTVIDISNAVYCAIMAIAPGMLSPIADLYGRRITFLLCTFFFSVSTLLVALSQNLVMFFIFRACTAIFGTPFLTVGAMVVSDLFEPHERGTALSWTLATSQFGPAFSPILGGIFVTYTNWRVTFWFLFGAGVAQLVSIYFLLPETGHSVPYVRLSEERKRRLIWLPYNPFKALSALKYTNFWVAGFISIAIMYNMYGILTPIRDVMDPRFNLTDPIYGSLFYLGPGCGYIVGSLFGGRWADHCVKKYFKKRGYRYPEDRLRSMHFFLGFLLPASMLIYGWSLEKKVGGIALPVTGMFLSGMAQTFCFPSVNTYCTDCMPELGGSGISSNYMLRYIGATISSATILKQIESIGIGWTCTISSLILWTSYVMCLILIKNGHRFRKVEQPSAEELGGKFSI